MKKTLIELLVELLFRGLRGSLKGILIGFLALNFSSAFADAPEDERVVGLFLDSVGCLGSCRSEGFRCVGYEPAEDAVRVTDGAPLHFERILGYCLDGDGYLPQVASHE